MTTSSVAPSRFTFGRSRRGRSNPGRSYLRIVWEAASAPMSIVLFGVSAVLVTLGLTLDAAVTAIPLLLNVLVTAGLGARAKHRLEQVRILSASTATVIRHGVESRVDTAQLVQGEQVVVGREARPDHPGNRPDRLTPAHPGTVEADARNARWRFRTK